MFDVLKTLSGLVKNRDQKKMPKPGIKQPEPIKVKKQEVTPVPGYDQINRLKQTEASIKIAEAKAKEIIIEAKDQAFNIKQQTEADIRKRLEAVDRREGALSERENSINLKLEELEQKIAETENTKTKLLSKLEQVSRLTHDQARDLMLEELKRKLEEEVANQIREATVTAQEQAEEKAREILIEAMRHGATEYVPEYTVSVVKIADEDVKGRIIGKEGRNIRTFETATGVDVDLDEEGVIRLSSFDPVRREIARVSLERLIKDGRVQPGRIEDLIKQVKKEIERIMFEEGQKLCHAVGVYNLPAPLVAMLGRFKYRFSYGQNMIAHTLEETKIGVALAHEIGADVNIVRLGCLLHDIGKVESDKEGSHINLGVELLKKYGIPSRVVDCVAQHHEDVPFSSIESVMVYISDAISGSRPGARYENYDEYIKRLKDLEDIAKSHKGVKEAYAFQAGRELRVIVNPEDTNDNQVVIMARDIKDEIEKKVTFPGQVKVTVIRELRASEIAV